MRALYHLLIWLGIWKLKPIDPNTGRPIGNHGTANDAIEFILWNHQAPGEETEFLRAWQDGTAWEEWPEYYEWLKDQGR